MCSLLIGSTGAIRNSIFTHAVVDLHKNRTILSLALKDSEWEMVKFRIRSQKTLGDAKTLGTSPGSFPLCYNDWLSRSNTH